MDLFNCAKNLEHSDHRRLSANRNVMFSCSLHGDLSLRCSAQNQSLFRHNCYWKLLFSNFYMHMFDQNYNRTSVRCDRTITLTIPCFTGSHFKKTQETGKKKSINHLQFNYTDSRTLSHIHINDGKQNLA